MPEETTTTTETATETTATTAVADAPTTPAVEANPEPSAEPKAAEPDAGDYDAKLDQAWEKYQKKEAVKRGESVEDEPASEGEPEAAQDDAKSEPSAEQQELDRYKQALKRENWPDEVLASLPADRIKALGEKATKRRTDQDRAGNELRDLKQEIANLKATLGSGAGGEKKAAVEQAAGKVEDALQSLAEIHGDEFVAPFRKEFSKYDTRVNQLSETFVTEIAKRDQAIAQQQAAVQYLVQALEQQMLSDTRRRLSEQYPQLKDGEVWKKVRDKMANTLAKIEGSDYYDDGLPDIDKMMSDAVSLVKPSLTVKDQQEQMLKRASRQLKGQVNVKSGARTPVKAMSDEERENHVLELIMKGKTRDEIKALMSRS